MRDADGNVIATGGGEHNAKASAVVPLVVGTIACEVAEPCGLGEAIFIGLWAIANSDGMFTKAYVPPPKDLPGFPGATKVKPKAGRARWVMPDGKIVEWDSQHGKVEVYGKSGKVHIGEFDPDTGEQTKGPDPSRSTPK